MKFSAKLVNSTAVSMIGLQEDSNTLRVIFKQGAGYDYTFDNLGDAKAYFQQLCEADSVGVEFNDLRKQDKLPQNIKLDKDAVLKFVLEVFTAAGNNLVEVEV